MQDDDLFPQPITFDRLYAEEKTGEVADPVPASSEEKKELARAVKLPPLTEFEEESLRGFRLDAAADPALDDYGIADQAKRADDAVSQKFFSENKKRLRRPWDDVDLG